MLKASATSSIILTITASRIAALWDLNPYLSREQLADIMRGTTTDGTGSIPDSPAMRRGRILEPAVAAALEEERPEWKPLVKATTYHRLPDLRLGASPDYFVGDDGSFKTVSAQHLRLARQTSDCHTLQTHRDAQPGSSGLPRMPRRQPVLPLYFYDAPPRRSGAAHIDAVAAWWRAWDRGDVAGPAASAELEAELDDGSYVDLSGDNELSSLLPERAELRATTSAAERRLKDIDATIKSRLGAASTAWLPGWAISFKAQQRKEFVVPAATIRVLRVKASDEDSVTDESAA